MEISSLFLDCHQLNEKSFMVVKSYPGMSRGDVKVCSLILGGKWGIGKRFLPLNCLNEAGRL